MALCACHCHWYTHLSRRFSARVSGSKDHNVRSFREETRNFSFRYDNRHQEPTDPLFPSEDFLANQGLVLEDLVASDMCSDLKVSSK